MEERAARKKQSGFFSPASPPARRAAFFWLAVILAAGGRVMASSPYAKVNPLPLSRVRITGGFWAEKQDLVLQATLPAEWEQLEKHHHLDNFRVAAGRQAGVHQGLVFFDSDLYKWLEAASYMLGKRPEARELRGRVDEAAGLICAAQQPDGYLNTYYQSFGPDRRLRVLLLNHELYCAGHLIEAAVAHHSSLQETALIDAARRFGDFLAREFGPSGKGGFDGHEEIELALIRLFRETGDRKYLDLAAFFLHQRGRSRGFALELMSDLREQAALEARARQQRAAFAGETGRTDFGFSFGNPLVILRSTSAFLSGRYFQADKPIEEYTAAEGHAVRAMYYFTGAADLYLETGDQRLLSALLITWENTISRRTYITGGMGSAAVTEGFGRDYELPNRSYAETCAAAGSIFWNFRMLLATGQARFADQLERTLYNGFLAGLGLDGRHFFYQNPLASFGKDERKEWYTVACCPPNLARVIASLEQYLFGESREGLWIHQYVTSTAEFRRPEGKVELAVESGLPWEGRAAVRVNPAQPMSFMLSLRLPAWSPRTEVRLNGEPFSARQGGATYLGLTREWKGGEVVEVSFVMEPRLVVSPPAVRENRDKAALLLGPLVYCLEDKDNPGVDVHHAVLAADPGLSVERRPDLLGGVSVIRGRLSSGAAFVAVPYFAWQNRGPSQMEVWLRLPR